MFGRSHGRVGFEVQVTSATGLQRNDHSTAVEMLTNRVRLDEAYELTFVRWKGFRMWFLVMHVVHDNPVVKQSRQISPGSFSNPILMLQNAQTWWSSSSVLSGASCLRNSSTNSSTRSAKARIG